MKFFENANETRMVSPETDQGLYQAKIRGLKKTVQSAMLTKEIDEELWDKRLGHYVTDNISKSLAIESGIPTSAAKRNDVPNYNDFIIAESCRKPHKVLNILTNGNKNPLALLFNEVIGPIRKPSIGGSHYFVTLIDDASGYSLVRFLPRKSEASEGLKKMID